MNDELFEVAFSGQIAGDADLNQVKAKVAAMFKADETKLAHLFSGKRVVIKKNIDQATANKYKTALNNAGAVCEIKSLTTAAPKQPPENPPENPPEQQPVQQPEKIAEVATPPSVQTQVEKSTPVATASGDVPAAPKTDPLGISAQDISDLTADIAPVGSDMLDKKVEVAEPELDISGMEMAPAGSDLGQLKKEDEPPPPDTSGISLVE